MRGYFYESYNQKIFNTLIDEEIYFVQDNHSYSNYGVLRGLHYQKKPYEQGKLVRVIAGEVFDVAVDLRKDSDTFGKYFGLILNASNKKQLWIPEGFAHGFLTLSDHVEFLYKTTNFYDAESEMTINWDDKEINIDWPLGNEINLSKKDSAGISFKEFCHLMI